MANELSTWTGAASTDWAAVGNWDTADVPDSGDTAVLNGRSAQAPVSNITGQGAIDLEALIVTREYRFGLGTAASSMTISANRLEVYGGTQIYYTDGAGTTDEVIVLAPANTFVYLAGDTFTNITVGSGQCTIVGGGNIGRVNVGGWGLNPVVNILDNGNTLTDLRVKDGTCFGSMITTRAHVSGGTFTHGLSDGTVSTRALTTVTVDGGNFVHNGTADITLADCLGGTVDFGAQEKAITTLRITQNCNVKRLLADGGFPWHQVTNRYDYRNRI